MKQLLVEEYTELPEDAQNEVRYSQPKILWFKDGDKFVRVEELDINEYTEKETQQGELQKFAKGKKMVRTENEIIDSDLDEDGNYVMSEDYSKREFPGKANVPEQAKEGNPFFKDTSSDTSDGYDPGDERIVVQSPGRDPIGRIKLTPNAEVPDFLPFDMTSQGQGGNGNQGQGNS